MVYVNAILVAAVRQRCNSCATVLQHKYLYSVAQHLTCATPGLEQVLCMFNSSRALFNIEPGCGCLYICLLLYSDKKVNRWAQKKHVLRRQACRREKSGGPKEMLTRLEDVDAALAQHARSSCEARRLRVERAPIAGLVLATVHYRA